MLLLHTKLFCFNRLILFSTIYSSAISNISGICGLFIEVNEGGLFGFVAEYNQKCLTKKTRNINAFTYYSAKANLLKNIEYHLKAVIFRYLAPAIFCSM